MSLPSPEPESARISEQAVNKDTEKENSPIPDANITPEPRKRHSPSASKQDSDTPSSHTQQNDNGPPSSPKNHTVLPTPPPDTKPDQHMRNYQSDDTSPEQLSSTSLPDSVSNPSNDCSRNKYEARRMHTDFHNYALRLYLDEPDTLRCSFKHATDAFDAAVSQGAPITPVIYTVLHSISDPNAQNEMRAFINDIPTGGYGKVSSYVVRPFQGAPVRRRFSHEKWRKGAKEREVLEYDKMMHEMQQKFTEQSQTCAIQLLIRIELYLEQLTHVRDTFLPERNRLLQQWRSDTASGMDTRPLDAPLHRIDWGILKVLKEITEFTVCRDTVSAAISEPSTFSADVITDLAAEVQRKWKQVGISVETADLDELTPSSVLCDAEQSVYEYLLDQMSRTPDPLNPLPSSATAHIHTTSILANILFNSS